MNKLYLIIVSMFMCYGCGELKDILDIKDGKDGKDGTTTIIYQDATSDTEEETTEEEEEETTEEETTEEEEISIETTAINPSGYAEAANCLGYSDIDIVPLNSQLKQTGAYHKGETSADNTGRYTIYADIISPYGQFGFDGDCRRETTSGTVNIKMQLITNMSSEDKNLNFPGTIQAFIAKDHFFNPEHIDYGNITASLSTAKTEILEFFNMPSTTKKFSEMTLQGGTIDDAVMALISATIDYQKTGSEQNAFLKEIAEGILDNNLILKTQINIITNNLPLKTIRDNLNTMFIELGIPATSPPIWDLSKYSYYTDLLTRTPITLETFNISASSTCIFDTSGYNKFAYPFVFSNIESAKYFATELSGSLSIYSVTTCNNKGIDYLCPNVKINDMEIMVESLLDDPIQLNYSYSLNENSYINDTQYFIVQIFDSSTQPIKQCTGDLLSFGKILALAIDQIDWNNAIGWDNSTNFFNRSPKAYTKN